MREKERREQNKEITKAYLDYGSPNRKTSSCGSDSSRKRVEDRLIESGMKTQRSIESKRFEQEINILKTASPRINPPYPASPRIPKQESPQEEMLSKKSKEEREAEMKEFHDRQ